MLAAVLVCVVTHSVVFELARLCVAAWVVAAACLAAAIAVFSGLQMSFISQGSLKLEKLDPYLHDSVPALLASNGRNAEVRAEAGRIDCIASDTRADVSNAARREMRDAIGGGGVHDVLLAGVARLGAQRATLLRVHNVGLRAGLRGAIMHGAVSVAGFVAISGFVSEGLGFGDSVSQLTI